MLGLPRIVAVLVLAVACSAAARAQPAPTSPPSVAAPPQAPPSVAASAQVPLPAAGPPLYLIVPFGEPGDTDPVLLDSTQRFSQDLSDRGIRSALGVPTEAVEAVSNAHLTCGQYRASGILVSELRFAQTKGFNAPQFAAGFIPYVGGVISGVGALDRTSIHAQYKLFLVNCWGKVVWRTITTAQKVHHGANVAAGLTDIGFRAIEEAADQFAARRSQAR
jgi:hypothetical protein